MSVTEQDVRAAAPANAPEDVVKWVAEIAELTTLTPLSSATVPRKSGIV